MTRTTDATLAKLEALCGPRAFSASADSLETYSIAGATPRALVSAEDAEMIAEVLRFAAEEKLAVVPVAGGAQLSIGAAPARYDIALRVAIEGVVSYDPGDLTLTVAAGTHLSTLSETLWAQKQFLPLDSQAGDFSSVGGVLATNSSGPLRHAYGTARDFLLGCEFVSGEGIRTRSGSRVVKSVSGYDIHKLLIGSWGTLGVITTANFRTFPMPPAQSTFVICFADAAGGLALRRAVLASRLTPRALDIISPQAARFLRQPESAGAGPLALPEFDWGEIRAELGDARADKYEAQHREALAAAGAFTTKADTFAGFSSSEWTVLVSAAGNERVVERHGRELNKMAEQCGAAAFHEATPDGHTGASFLDAFAEWRWARAFHTCLPQFVPQAAILKLSVLPEAAGPLIERVRGVAGENGFHAALLLRSASIIQCALVPDEEAEFDANLMSDACTGIFAAAQAAGGHAMLESAPAEVKARAGVWGSVRSDATQARVELELMRRLKKEFDPHGILSPGRMVGGL